MSFAINTNLPSINAQRQLGLNQSGLATSMQRLSSGLRVNTAKDDAAGLAISERMLTQIRGTNQAARNANDGISMLQTAEGASSKVNDMLQRMRELAVQSINFTNSDDDRKALNAEVQQLKAEVDRIGMTSKFNGAAVFATSRASAIQGDLSAHGVLNALKGGVLAQVEQVIFERYGIQARGSSPLEIITERKGAGGFAAYVAWDGSGNQTLSVDLDDYGGDPTDPGFIDLMAHEMVHAIMGTGQSWAAIGGNSANTWFTEGLAEYIYGADGRVSSHGGWAAMQSTVNGIIGATWNSSSEHYAAGYIKVRHLDEWLKDSAGGGQSEGIKAVLNAIHNETHATLADAVNSVIVGSNTYATFTGLTAFASQPAWLDLTNADSGGIGGADATGGIEATRTGSTPLTAAASTDMANFAASWQKFGSADRLGNILGFQVGANAGQFVYARVGSLNLGALGMEELNVATASDATAALGQLDSAIDYVSSLRGELGAQMNRFEAVIATLNVMVENTSASRGRIVDADFAQETANLSRTQILQQASTAMVSQANQLPQNVLSLLR